MNNLVALVTGTRRGLGSALVEALVGAGARVYAGDHTLGEGSRPGVTNLGLDVTDLSTVEAAARRIEAEVGHLDLVINNAGVLGDLDRAAEGDLDYDSMKNVFDVNALGPLRVCQTFWPLLQRGPFKLIVNISSEAGSISQCGRDGWFGYGMSKAALNMASVQFHNAIRSQGGRVLVVHPGWVQTFMRGHRDEQAPLTPEQSAEAILRLIEARGHESHSRPLFLQWDGSELPW